MNNALIDLANNTGSGAINNAGALMDGPIGYVVYFTIGISVIGVVVFAVKKWM